MKKKSLIAICSLFALTGLFASCSEDDPGLQTSGDPAGSGNEQPGGGDSEELVQGSYADLLLSDNARKSVNVENKFAFSLLDATIEENNNTAISPLSVFITLSALANADNGATQADLISVLGAGSEASLSDINEYCNSVISQIDNLDSSVKCRLATSFWHLPGLVPTESFKSSLGDIFKADIFSANINEPEGEAQLNSWISDKTEGLITNFFKSDVDTYAAIVNTTYFKGLWQHNFEKEKTRPMPFHSYNGNVSQVPFMCQTNKYLKAYQSDELDMVELNIGFLNFSMVIAMPKNQSVKSLVRNLGNMDIDGMLSSYHPGWLELSLPKFNCSYNKDLLGTIKGMGLSHTLFNSMFVPKTENDIYYLSAILHGVSINVDEDGTEAAGVTIGHIVGDSEIEETKRTVMTFDHPFVFFIREKTSGTIVFAGNVSNL